jgi:hypothetical protein
MINMYIDESGSINPFKTRLKRYFVVGIVIPKNKERLRRVYKLFIRKNFEELKEADKYHKMFDDKGNFIELKGSCFTEELKIKFVDFFCKNDLFEIRYIVLDNNLIEPKFVKNKARTFNYLLKLFLINSKKKGYVNDKEIYLHIDERNVKTDSKFSLEDYLNQELVLSAGIIENATVEYYDSCQNVFIQIADIFSNLLYSNMLTNGKYDNKIKEMKEKGYILPTFIFPQNKFIKNTNKIQ